MSFNDGHCDLIKARNKLKYYHAKKEVREE